MIEERDWKYNCNTEESESDNDVKESEGDNDVKESERDNDVKESESEKEKFAYLTTLERDWEYKVATTPCCFSALQFKTIRGVAMLCWPRW